MNQTREPESYEIPDPYIQMCLNCESVPDICGDDPEKCHNYFTYADAERVYKMLKSGKTIGFVAKKFGIGPYHLYTLMGKAGYAEFKHGKDFIRPEWLLNTVGRKMKLSDNVIKKAFELVKKGYTLQKAADEFGISRNGLLMRLLKMDEYIKYRDEQHEKRHKRI